MGAGWKFQELYSHVFGLPSAVINFNRFSETDASHLAPIARAPDLHVMTVQDFASAPVCGQTSMRELFALIRRPVDQPKAKEMAPRQDFCGLEHDFSETFTAGPASSAVLEIGRNHVVLVYRCTWDGEQRRPTSAHVRRCQALPPQPPPATCSHQVTMMPKRVVTTEPVRHRPFIVVRDGQLGSEREPSIGVLTRCPIQGLLCFPRELAILLARRRSTPTLFCPSGTGSHHHRRAWMQHRDVIWFVHNSAALASIVRGKSKCESLDVCGGEHATRAPA